MTITIRRFVDVVGAAALLFLGATTGKAADDVIKVGAISSYSTAAGFTVAAREGSELAAEQINAKGGPLGKKLEFIYRDDAGEPGDAVLRAQELVTKDHVALLSGAYFSHVGLAVSEFANHNKILFVASEPLTDALVWEKGTEYTFRLRTSTYMQAAMLAEEAAKTSAKRWAVIAPNFEYGKSFVAAFQERLSALRPDVTWVGEQWPPFGKIDAGAAVQAVELQKPDGIFNVLYGGPLTAFIREGNVRGLFKDRVVVAPILGEPEYLDPLGAETPVGWIVTGYPWDQIKTPAHDAFVKAYQAKFGHPPHMGALVGYITAMAIAADIAKAGSTDTAKMIAAFKGLVIESPVGPITFRAIDHQSTMGTFVGRLAIVNGKGEMTDWHYRDGKDYLPGDDVVRKRRPGS